MTTEHVTLAGREMVRISCDSDHILHRIGSGDYAEIRRATVDPSAVADWEEIPAEEGKAARLAKYKAEEYSKRLSAAIHERYSMDDEIALAANINAPMLLNDEEAIGKIAEEYAAYQAYRAECKQRVRAEIDNITELPKP